MTSVGDLLQNKEGINKIKRLLEALDSDDDDLFKIYKDVQKVRDSFKSWTFEDLKYTGARLDVSQLPDSLPEGYIKIYSVMEFDCYFKSNNSDNLYVFFNGARSDPLPNFKRWTYSKYINGDLLNISDPMYETFPDLYLGWYYGTKEENYREYIATLIKEIFEKYNYSRLILFASSGGGNAAVHIASLINMPATCVLINPQLVLDIYPFSNKFKMITGIDVKDDPLFKRNSIFEHSLQKIQILYVANICSQTDIPQMVELVDNAHVPIKYGLNQYKKITTWIYAAPGGEPHNNQEYYPMLFPLLYLIDHLDKVNELKSIYKLFSEFWFDHYHIKDDFERKSLGFKSSILGKCVKPQTITDRVTICKSKKPWAFQPLFEKVYPNSTYILSINQVSSESKKCVLVIKNRNNGEVVYQHDLGLSERTIAFTTHSNTVDYEIRLYAYPMNKPSDDDTIVDYSLTLYSDYQGVL